MRGFAWRRRGFETLELCGGPTNTAIVRTTITASHHGCQRSRAARAWPTAAGRDEQQRVIWMRRPARNCRGRDDENLKAGTKAAGITAPLAFATPGVGLEPPCPADAVARRNWAAARMFPPGKSAPCADAQSSPSRHCARAVHRGARSVSPRRNRQEPFRPVERFTKCRRSMPPRSAPAVATGSGADRFAAGQIGSTGSAPRREGAAQPPRCLKRLGTSLEARGQRYSRAEKRCGRREPRAEATLAFRGRAFCRALPRKSPLQVNQQHGLSASSGWLRRPG
jgi:hypothetical protein